MAKLSKETAANHSEQGPATEWSGQLEGYTVSFVNLSEDADLTPLLQGLPDDQCSCPHWGYVFAGRMWFKSEKGEESYEAGDAFYVPAGHTAGADGGSEFVVFSPATELAQVEAHMMRRAQELAAASS